MVLEGDDRVAQQRWPDIVLRMFLARVGLRLNRNQTHKTHQTPEMMTATLAIIAFYVTRHLARPIPRRLRQLLVDDLHNPQVFGALILLRIE